MHPLEINNYEVVIRFGDTTSTIYDAFIDTFSYKFKTHKSVDAFIEGLKYMYHRDNNIGYSRDWGFGNHPLSHIQTHTLNAPEYESYMLGINQSAQFGTMGFKIV